MPVSAVPAYTRPSPAAMLQPITITTVSSKVIPGNPRRRSLILFAPATNATTYHPSNPVVSGTGIVMRAGDPPLVMERIVFGSLVTGDLWGITAAAIETLNAVEVLE